MIKSKTINFFSSGKAEDENNATSTQIEKFHKNLNI